MQLWTDENSRGILCHEGRADITAFIEAKYPWFLPTFDSYPYNIQRADVIRYFALAYYGGNYLDLDLVCLQRFVP